MGMNFDHLDVHVTPEDIEAAKVMGATPNEVMEAAIHTALDREGIPREGRRVKVTGKNIEISYQAR
ncbi:hypothetical protein QQY66_45635 [Streptomyces sp. DG2A-72]|uniref:hypothetical protein n=1 Tax=Streptomyces sp. DG2A-72 TaxID=3051386 RepID=UPI00265B8F6F|nr:hypothetical protein [Streptomyces sp. DG2A-72]MDO0938651.1 hypothetical protein [Streptomyces sp. DG2A-72]